PRCLPEDAMNRPSPTLVAAAAGIVALAAFALRPAPAAALTDADAGVLPPFDAAPFPEEKTPMPKVEEWKPATPVALTSALPRACNAYRVREWVKIHCSDRATSSIALLGGSREGVGFFLVPPRSGDMAPMAGDIVFPVRRDDRRMIEWSTFGDSYDGVGTPEFDFMISESWAPGDPGP